IGIVQVDEVDALGDEMVVGVAFGRVKMAPRLERALRMDGLLGEPFAERAPKIVAGAPGTHLMIADPQEHRRRTEGNDLPLDKVLPGGIEVIAHGGGAKASGRAPGAV